MSYLTLSSQEKHLFYSLHTFTRIRQHYFSKYWGTNAWAVPTPQIFWGDRPPVPLDLRPCLVDFEIPFLLYFYTLVLRVCLEMYCIVFIHFYSASHSMSLSEALPTTSIYTPKRYRQLQMKDLSQGPYVAARAGFKPTTIWVKVKIWVKVEITTNRHRIRCRSL